MSDIRLTVDGRPALTTAQASAVCGRDVPVMRMLLSRRRVRPVAYLDGRTPLWDAADIAALMP